MDDASVSAGGTCRHSFHRLPPVFSDPRLFQIFSLGILLATGVLLRDFSIRPAQFILTFAAAIVTQSMCWRLNP